MLKSLIILCFIITINSCALSNDKTVPVSIHTVPNEADIYINNEKYNKKTSTIIDLEPNKDYNIFLRKDGYQNVHFVLRKKNFGRSGLFKDSIQSKRCFFDKFLIIPSFLKKISSSYALRCNDFESREYDINLTKIEGYSDNKNQNNNVRKRRSYREMGLFPYAPSNVPPQHYMQEDPRVPGYNDDMRRKYYYSGW